MKSRPHLAVGLASLALVVGLGACSSAGKNTTATTAGGIANAVTIKNFAFLPKDLAVKVGADVTWRNTDGVNHQIAIKDGALSDPISQGGRTILSFTKAGTFDYFCNIHKSMTGTVTVTG